MDSRWTVCPASSLFLVSQALTNIVWLSPPVCGGTLGSLGVALARELRSSHPLHTALPHPFS
jgi:hypothetical protein